METTADMVFSDMKWACLGRKFALMELERVLLRCQITVHVHLREKKKAETEKGAFDATT